MSKPKKDFKPDLKAGALEGKVQTNGQEAASDVSTVVDSPKGGSPEINIVEEPKSAINTKRAAEVVTAGQSSSGIGGLRRGAIVFGGGAGVTQGDESATTRENTPYKSGDRTGRRADPITRKVDLIDAEIIETKRYQSKPLSETSEGQGYNGNYENEHVITQKNSGGAPADPMFERSIDEIDIDMLYYPNGQFNIAKGSKDLSIRTWDSVANAYEENPVSVPVGNHMARKLYVSFGEVDGKASITNFVFDKSDLSVPFIDEQTSRLAGDAYMRDRNIREIDRNTMISTAGNESDPSWSCLGDAIIDPTDQNRFLAWLDAMAGNYVGLSVRKLDEALAYQVNKVAKDGSRVTGPMAEMVNGCIEDISGGAHASVDENQGRSKCFNKNNYKKGSAALWLALNDSLAKYTTKGKLLSLPLSFKSASATAHSNMDPLVANTLLFDELQHNELFSTIDGPYDPLKPIVVTDKANLITPIPIDVCKTGTIFNTSTKKLENTVYVMHYENLRNKYNVSIKNFFIEGIYRWFDERAQRILDLYDGDDVTIEIPVVSAATSISLWDLIVCSAVPYIVEARLTTFTEVLKYEKNHGYPYSGVAPLKTIDVAACDNYSYSSNEAPLTPAIAKPIAAMKVIMPEVFWPVSKREAECLSNGHNGVAAYTVLPHYFVQNQFAYDIAEDDADTTRKLVLSDDSATMAYPTTRSGNMLSFMDTIYGMSEEDYRLSLDRMVVYPGYERSYPDHDKIAGTVTPGVDDKVFDTLTYKYGMTADGTPVIPYFAYANSASNAEDTLTVADILATPRELGLFQVAPAGVLTPMLDENDGDEVLNTVSVDSSYLFKSGPGFRAKIYHGIGNDMDHTILNDGSVNIDANASFRNQYVIIDANPYSSNVDYGFMLKRNGTSGTMLRPFTTGAYDLGSGEYDYEHGIYLGDETGVTAGMNIFVNSYMKYFWTRIQRLPFVINPFDCNGSDISEATGSWAPINNNDIYDVLYFFGFAGFRASDFHELVYQRVKERVAKGMNYVNDPFVTKSMLLK